MSRRVVQVGFHIDAAGRPPEALLDAWPTLAGAAAAAAREGWEVTVVQPATEDASLRRDGVLYRFVGERPGFRRGPPGVRVVRAAAPRLGAVVASLEPDLVHVQGLALPGHVRRLRSRLGAGVRVLAQDHADRPPTPWRRAGYRRDAAAFDAVAFTAREQATPFVEAGVLSPALPVLEVLEGSTRFRPAGGERPGVHAGARGRPCLAWVGRLDRNKDPLTILDALARAAPRLPDAHLWCCYREAPLLEPVRRRVAETPGLAGRVHLLGAQPPSTVEGLLRRADALLLGSAHEGSGYAVLEAMACGATPLVPDIPPLRRIVGDAGVLWPRGDAAALAEALVAWWGRGDARPRRERVRARFEAALSWDAVGRELSAAYRTCLAASPRPPAGARGPVGSRPGFARRLR